MSKRAPLPGSDQSSSSAPPADPSVSPQAVDPTSTASPVPNDWGGNDQTTSNTCDARFKAGFPGTFKADISYPISGAAGVRAEIDGGDLRLFFPYAPKFLSDNYLPTRVDRTGQLRINGGQVFDEGYETVACSESGYEQPREVGQEKLLFDHAKLTITTHSATLIEGSITVPGQAANLTFSAPLDASPPDRSVCCLVDRSKWDETTHTPDEIAAICKARYSAAPRGTYDTDGVAGDPTTDLIVTITSGTSTDSDGFSQFTQTLELHFSSQTKGVDPERGPYETTGSGASYYTLYSVTEMPPPFKVGRYEDIQTSSFGGSQTCGNGWSEGGSGGDDDDDTLVITSITDTEIEGSIETPSGTSDPPSIFHFKAPLNPPPRLGDENACCLQ
jgi:hypothetical protein